MAISNAELGQIFQMTGLGFNVPYSTPKPFIASTYPLIATSGAFATGSGQPYFNPIYIIANQTISNITYISGSQAESGGTHLWYALYDDGRSSTTAGQLALLRQTADQTGATAFAANTALSLSLLTPYTTTYTGIYYVAFMCAFATLGPSLLQCLKNNVVFQYAAAANAINGGTIAAAGLTSQASNPSGAISGVGQCHFAYVS